MMHRRAIPLVACLSLLLLWAGCDALVGGECLPGYVAQGTACVLTDVGGGGTGAATGPGGQGGATSGGGGQGGASSATSNGGGNPNGGNSGKGGNGGSGGSGGSIDCPMGLTWCPPDGCVDTQTDFHHCGQCDNYCSTELCVAGICLGLPNGHLIVIGMSYAASNTPTETLLGNAIFLPPDDPVRILDFRKYGHAATVTKVEATIKKEAEKRNRTYGLAVEPIAAILASDIASGKYDVLLIHDQPNAIPSVLAAVGSAIATEVLAFAKNGGTVVVLASDDGTNEMHQLLTNSQILTTQELSPFNGIVLNQVPNDVMGISVPSMFLSKPITVTIDTSDMPSQFLANVFTDAMMKPVVIHRTVSN